MGLSTPIDRHYKFGELFSIRGTYSRMSESIEMNKLEERFYNSMISHIVESGNMDKIERFARKNRVLCDFTVENSINEAYDNAELELNKLNIPKVIRQKAKRKAKMAVSDKALSIKTDSYALPEFTAPMEEPTIYEAIEDYVDNDDEHENIEKIIKDVAKENGYIGNEKSHIKSDNNEEEAKDPISSIKHNYSIQSIVIEAIAGNDRHTQLIPATSLFEETTTNEKNILNSTIKGVTDTINSVCGINFTENDYIWLASGRPVPHFNGELAVTSELVKGNRMLNTYFGPAGTYKDYLYKADGTPRIEQNKASSMNDVDKEVNAIQSYPIVKVYATVISWDNVNGKDTVREISPDDFYGTSIKYVK